MQVPIIAANWKLNKSPAEARRFFRAYLDRATEIEQNHSVFFPSAFSLEAAADCLEGTPATFGAQNCWWQDEGAFTGENSPVIAREIGAHWSLVGHSERRQLFHEGDELLAKKIKVAQSHGLVPLFCIGETLEEREGGGEEAVWKRQLEMGLTEVDVDKPMAIAYEPVWAIGTGKVASKEQVEAAHHKIREILTEIHGAAWSKSLPLLYGGSVKPESVEGLAEIKEVNGFLVGGASLQVESFKKIVVKTLEVKKDSL